MWNCWPAQPPAPPEELLNPDLLLEDVVFRHLVKQWG